MRRHRLNRRGSKRLFSKTANIHPKNNAGSPMRGGIRL